MVFVSLILLLGSNAFMEFTTSGLENPLSFAVIGTYITLLLRFSVTPPRAFQSCVIGVTLAAALLTRMDLAILVLIPTLGFVWHHRRSARQIIVMMTGAIVPLLVWLTWSWVTYASILPNTFAAKRNLDIPLMEILHQGVFYVLFGSRWDVGTAFVIILGVLAGALRRGTTRWFAAGVILYLTYAVANGGDFMAGRFLAVPAYVCVFLIVCQQDVWATVTARGFSWIRNQNSKVQSALAMMLCLLILGIAAGLAFGRGIPVSITAPHNQRWDFQNSDYSHGIADERGVWVSWAHRSLWDLLNKSAPPGSTPTSLKDADVTAPLSSISNLANNWPTRMVGDHVPNSVEAVGAVIGTWGIEMGPKFHIVDTSALTDRFLADQPFVGQNYDWRIGHFGRSLPAGYLDAIKFDNPYLLANPKDARHLEDLWSRIKPSPQN